MERVADKIYKDKISPHILCSVTFFSENSAVCDIMWKNTSDSNEPRITRWRMRIACWISKATNTHSGRALLTAFQEHSSLLRDLPVLLISYTLSSIVLWSTQLLRCIPLKLRNIKFLYAMQQCIVCVRVLISVLSYAEFESSPSPAGQRIASLKLWTVFG